jgi:hypothetical protein
MKFFYLFLLFWRPFAGWAYELPADVDLGIPFQKEALANSLRCLETIRGDEERIARTRIFVAENLAYFGDEQAAITLLRGSRPHYHVPSGCVDSAMVFLGHGQRNAVRQLLNLALDLLPFAAGRGAELVQFQILRMATVTGDKTSAGPTKPFSRTGNPTFGTRLWIASFPTGTGGIYRQKQPAMRKLRGKLSGW